MARYIMNPVVIEAVQYTGNNYDEIKRFAGDCCKDSPFPDNTIRLATSGGFTFVEPGEYVAKNAKGGFYRLDAASFLSAYRLKEGS